MSRRVMKLSICYWLLLCFSLISTQAFAEKNILILGDSLSAGFNLEAQKDWPSLLQYKLSDMNLKYHVSNASVSGQTSAEGLSQIDRLLKTVNPAVVVIELGANDGLRGLSISEMRNNLSQMVEKSKKIGAKILIVGIRIPSNYGKRYTQRFYDTFQQVADTYDVQRLPFLLEPIALNPDMFLEDRLHPSAEAQPIILNHLWPYLEKIL